MVALTELRAINWGLLAFSFFLTGAVAIEELLKEDLFYPPPLRFYLGAFGLPVLWWAWFGFAIADAVHRFPARRLLFSIAAGGTVFLAYAVVAAMTPTRG